MIRTILRDILNNYGAEKLKPYTDNQLASRVRGEYPAIIREELHLGDCYLVQGSCGLSRWAHCPWLAILDSTLTTTVQKEYYLVFLFKTDMTGVYLSLNQGVEAVRKQYRQTAVKVLRDRARDLRARMADPESYLYEINLGASNSKGLAKYYEAANVIACYYDLHSLPTEERLREDLNGMLKIYQDLVFGDLMIEMESNDEQAPVFVEEQKKIGFHARIERNGQVARKVKERKDCRCEVCGLSFEEMYGEIGRNFIEVHHLVPIAKLDGRRTKINLETGFAVLCSNCHRMIHKMPDPSDLGGLRKLIRRG